MRKTDEIYDRHVKIRTRFYELDNGIRLVHSIDPDSVETSINFIVHGGSYFEDTFNVPQGTAHFLEHILYGNPNDFLKTPEKRRLYSFGNKSKPPFRFNALTSHENISFYAFGNENGFERQMKFIRSQVDYPLHTVSRYIEKERKIILGELDRERKESRDADLLAKRFILDDSYPEYSKRVLGTQSSIKRITVDNLVNYWQSVFFPNNCIIAILTGKELTKNELNEIKKFQDLFTSFSKSKVLTIEKREINKSFRYSHYKNEDSNSIFFSINFLYDLKTNKIDYRMDKMRVLLADLFYYVSHEFLWEDKGLIYDIQTVNYSPSSYHKCRGFKLHCDRKNLPSVLDNLYKMLYVKASSFLETKQGQLWFQDQVSGYIFKINKGVNMEFADSIAEELLEHPRIAKYNYYEGKKAFLDLTIEEFQAFYDEFILKEPIFWFESPFDETEVFSELKKSKFYKKFKQKHEK